MNTSSKADSPLAGQHTQLNSEKSPERVCLNVRDFAGVLIHKGDQVGVLIGREGYSSPGDVMYVQDVSKTDSFVLPKIVVSRDRFGGWSIWIDPTEVRVIGEEGNRQSAVGNGEEKQKGEGEKQDSLRPADTPHAGTSPVRTGEGQEHAVDRCGLPGVFKLEGTLTRGPRKKIAEVSYEGVKYRGELVEVLSDDEASLRPASISLASAGEKQDSLRPADTPHAGTPHAGTSPGGPGEAEESAVDRCGLPGVVGERASSVADEPNTARSADTPLADDELGVLIEELLTPDECECSGDYQCLQCRTIFHLQELRLENTRLKQAGYPDEDEDEEEVAEGSTTVPDQMVEEDKGDQQFQWRPDPRVLGAPPASANRLCDCGDIGHEQVVVHFKLQAPEIRWVCQSCIARARPPMSPIAKTAWMTNPLSDGVTESVGGLSKREQLVGQVLPALIGRGYGELAAGRINKEHGFENPPSVEVQRAADREVIQRAISIAEMTMELLDEGRRDAVVPMDRLVEAEALLNRFINAWGWHPMGIVTEMHNPEELYRILKEAVKLTGERPLDEDAQVPHEARRAGGGEG